jgi:hypothetical protein
MILGALAGLTLGWTYLTREDSDWLLVGIALLAAGAILVRRKETRALFAVTRDIGLAAAVFSAVIIAVMTINLMAYGSFAVYGADEHNFAAAFDALQDVEAGPDKPYVPVTAAVRSKIAKVSPTFLALNRSLEDTDLRRRWRDPGCRLNRNTCGEYAAGWFAGALRDAAAMHGFYQSPKTAATNFAKIADEIAAACSDGILKCRPRSRSGKQAMTGAQWASLPATMEAFGEKVAFIDPPDPSATQLTTPNVAHDTFQRYWTFLNRPFVSKLGKRPVQTYARGWYRNGSSSQWPSFTVNAEGGQQVPFTVRRTPSPDLQKVFSDERLAWNRFVISYRCPNSCTIAARQYGRAELRVGPKWEGTPHTAADGAEMRIMEVTYDWQATADLTPLQKLAATVRTGLVAIYELLVPILLFAGLVALIAAIDGAIAARTLSPLLLLAAAAWILVTTRIVLLALTAVSSLPPMAARDFAPAAYLALVAAFLSFGAVVAQARLMRRPDAANGESA